MTLVDFGVATAIFFVQTVIVFAVSTLLFDALHYLLHRWQRSRFSVLRMFSSWHWVHHKFLTIDLKIDARYRWLNIWCHIVPEFVTATAGTLLFLFVFPWYAVAWVVVWRLIILVLTIKEEGMDFNHMAVDRVGGQQGVWWVSPHYHAMHHVYPNNFFSSAINMFDLIAGTTCQIRDRRFLVTGASGAFGSAMVEQLQRLGGVVETAKSGVDYAPGDYLRLGPAMERADVLVLAHGAKTGDCWNANHATFVGLIDLFTDIGKRRLTPPEVWALGSEIELHGDLGIAAWKDYAASKRAFALRAKHYFRSGDLIYRHIVPSAFTSAMGRGPMSAGFAAAWALFLIRRGFTYVPVTLTTLAFWNYFRFIFQAEERPTSAPNGPEAQERGGV